MSNLLPIPVAAAGYGEGRGMRGMRQRVELLGGAIEVGPVGNGWAVRAVVPLGDESGAAWGCG